MGLFVNVFRRNHLCPLCSVSVLKLFWPLDRPEVLVGVLVRLIEERQVPHFKLDFVKEVNRRPKFVFVACESVQTGRLFSVMLFYSFFKSLVGKDVVVELKNDLAIAGTLHSVDQYLNIKLTDIGIVDQDKYPHMLSVKNCFIRGSVVRYVQLPAEEIDTALLQDAARKESVSSKN